MTSLISSIECHPKSYYSDFVGLGSGSQSSLKEDGLHQEGGLCNPHFSRNPNDWVMERVEAFLSRLQGKTLRRDEENKMEWTSVTAKIERLQRDFLWSGVGEGKTDHLVSWDVVCNSKAKKGLGFGKISIRNFALLGKWLWRYPREGSTLWHQVILSIYFKHLWITLQWLGCQYYSQMVTSLSLEGYCTSLPRVF